MKIDEAIGYVNAALYPITNNPATNTTMIQTNLTDLTELDSEDGNVLLDHTAACVRAALDDHDLPRLDHPLATAAALGVFVSLKRGQLLRACCGSLNVKDLTPLAELLEASSEHAALADNRFPRVNQTEWPHLDLEISVMHNLEELPLDPNHRLNSVTIGKHGLIITLGKSRGLILPQVASDNNWDVPTFLERLCQKAGLETNSWLLPEAQIQKFTASIFHRPAEHADIDFSQLDSDIHQEGLKLARSLVKNGSLSDKQIPSSLQELTVPPSGWGLLIRTSGGSIKASFAKSGSLGELILDATEDLTQAEQPDANEVADFVGFSHEIMLDPNDYPDRLTSLPVGTAVTGRFGTKTSVVIKKGPQDAVLQVLKQMGQTPPTWKRSKLELHSHKIFNWLHPDTAKSPRPAKSTASLPSSEGIRPSSVDGKFYPDDPEDIKDQLDSLFQSYLLADNEQTRVPAVMLPHAGWKFCGDIIAETLGQIKIPDTVIMLGPKHTPLGPKWSISAAKSWQIPGAQIPLEEESVAYLAAHVGGMEKEHLAHQREHACEVLLPFLHYLNPNIKIVPIAVGSGTHDEFAQMGKVLKTFRNRLAADGEDCLFIISSDLNHFAEDSVNRKLDKMALDALRTGDTQRLFDICTQNNISMCGLRPAIAVVNSLDFDPTLYTPDVDIVRYETSARITNDPSRVVGYAGALLA